MKCGTDMFTPSVWGREKTLQVDVTTAVHAINVEAIMSLLACFEISQVSGRKNEHNASFISDKSDAAAAASMITIPNPLFASRQKSDFRT